MYLKTKNKTKPKKKKKKKKKKKMERKLLMARRCRGARVKHKSFFRRFRVASLFYGQSLYRGTWKAEDRFPSTYRLFTANHWLALHLGPRSGRDAKVSHYEIEYQNMLTSGICGFHSGLACRYFLVNAGSVPFK